MGQHCCCVNSKNKRIPPIKPLNKSKLDTSHLKCSLAVTASQYHTDPNSKKKCFDYAKENVDSILPNNSVMVSLYDVQTFDIPHKLNEMNEGSVEKKEINLETLFNERRQKPLMRDFDFQQDLNKPKINVLEIYKKDENGGWTEDLNMKILCKSDELNKINYSWKFFKDSMGRKDRDVIEELAP